MQNKQLQSVRVSFSKAISIGQEVGNLVLHDMEKFTKYGYTPSDFDNLVSTIEKLKQVPLDKNVLMQISEAAGEKNRSKEHLVSIIRVIATVMGRMRTANNVELVSVGIKIPFTISDEKLTNAILLVKNTFAQYVPGTPDNKVPVALADEFYSAVETYEQMRSKVGDTDISRTTLKMNRRALIQELYNELAYIMQIGKNIWHTSDPTMANRYTLSYYMNRKPESATSDAINAPPLVTKLVINQ